MVAMNNAHIEPDPYGSPNAVPFGDVANDNAATAGPAPHGAPTASPTLTTTPSPSTSTTTGGGGSGGGGGGNLPTTGADAALIMWLAVALVLLGMTLAAWGSRWRYRRHHG